MSAAVRNPNNRTDELARIVRQEVPRVAWSLYLPQRAGPRKTVREWADEVADEAREAERQAAEDAGEELREYLLRFLH